MSARGGLRARAWTAPRADAGARVRLRPSAAGLAWCALCAVLAAMAVNEANNLLYALCFLMLALGAVSLVQSWLNLRGLRVHVLGAAPVSAGSEGAVQLRVDAGARARHALQFTLAQTALPRPRPLGSWARLRAAGLGARRAARAAADPAAASTPTHAFDAGALQTLAIPWRAERRGWQQAQVLCVGSLYPLGLARARCELRVELQRLVWPRPAASAATTTMAADLRGQAATTFTGLDRWRQGDSARRLAWRAFARSGQPMVKRFDGECEEAACVLSFEHEHGDVEARIAVLTRRLLDAHAAGRGWVLRLPGQTPPLAAQDVAALHRDLRRLALYAGGAP